MKSAADFAVYPKALMWPSHSSGTSGSPVTVYRTPGASIYERIMLERQWSWFGMPSDARRVVLRGGDFAADGSNGQTKLISGDRQLLVSSFHLTSEALPAILAAIRQFQPDAVEGWPSSITLLAALLRDAGETLPVRGVITSSEVIGTAQRRLMAEAFSDTIIDHYGQTERAAMAGGCERGGYHVFPDYGIVELLPVPDRPDRWEIVGTPLHNFGFPLLRYRTGDEVGLAPNGPCPCGRDFPLIGRVDGRMEDAFVASDGRIIPLPSIVVDDLSGVAEAQILQLRRGCFEVRLAPGADFDAERARRLVLYNVERYIGPSEDVTIRTMDRIPRTSNGKLRSAVVINDRPDLMGREFRGR